MGHLEELLINSDAPMDQVRCVYYDAETNRRLGSGWVTRDTDLEQGLHLEDGTAFGESYVTMRRELDQSGALPVIRLWVHRIQSNPFTHEKAPPRQERAPRIVVMGEGVDGGVYFNPTIDTKSQ